MWFEQMHPKWRELLFDQREHLESLEFRIAKLPDLTPISQRVMAAFEADPATIKIVVLGQDPYPTEGAAIGHAFAVSRSTKIPASLKNIEAELASDVGATLADPELEAWRSQGVWLLNTSLSTLTGQPNAHSKIGWQAFTEAALTRLAKNQKLVILAWGNAAEDIANRVKTEDTRVVESAHPSPLSARRGFLGSHPFSRGNDALSELGLGAIDW